jgi:hypothetical protein
LIDNAGISIDDAARGQVRQLPHVQFIQPRTDMPPATPAAPPAAPTAQQ